MDNDKVDNNSLDKVETDNLDKIAKIPSEGKTLTQPSILNFLTKGVKRKKSQLTLEWPKKKQIILAKKILGKKEQAVNKKFIRKLVNNKIPTIIQQSFPMFAHLKNTKK